jgi:hypothetical protein
MALQHLRSNTASKRPTPASMADGQLAVNTNATSPGLFFKDAGGALVKVGPVHIGTSAPNSSPAGSSGNAVGEQWLDTSGGGYVLKIWDGSAWRSEVGEFVDATGDTMTGALIMDNQQQVRFRETTANGTNYIALQAPASVSSDKTITLPDVTGTVVTTGDSGTVTSTMILDGTIVDADVNASADIAFNKLANVSATDKLLGRSTAGAGPIEEIDCTSAGRALLDDADASAQRSTLGLEIGVDVQAYDADTAKLDTAQTFTAEQTFDAGVSLDGPFEQASEAVSALDVDCSAGNYFTKAISSNSTFTFSNIPTSGTAYSFTLEVDVTGTSTTITWPASVKWTADTAPSLTDTKTHLFMFVTNDGGTTWRGAALVDYTT